mmetsp:Transcript_33282/g.103759  ORF Transcript_33282/g.103759 Transcript_33282/m.103759 type:complete len:225 (+) Transcript_33282:839-1513(+)
MQGAGSGGSALAEAGRAPRMLQTSRSRLLRSSSTAPSAAPPRSSEAASEPPPPSSWLRPLMPPAPAIPPPAAAVPAMSRQSPLMPPSCACTAFRAWPRVRQFAWSRVGCHSHMSRGYIRCIRACIARPSRDFSQALAAPFRRSWASLNDCRSSLGSRSSQCSHSSPARQELAEGAKCTSTSETWAPGRSSTLTEFSCWCSWTCSRLHSPTPELCSVTRPASREP